MRSFADWFAAQPHPHKVVVAGNHDHTLELDPDLARHMFAGRHTHYLCDTEVTIDGVLFYGAPWQPEFCNLAFNLPRGERLRQKWALIDNDVDVLITHGPPFGVLDTTFDERQVGCEELLVAIERTRPALHLFGHIHEGYGWKQRGRTLHVNASSCTIDYKPDNPPMVIELAHGTATIV